MGVVAPGSWGTVLPTTRVRLGRQPENRLARAGVHTGKGLLQLVKLQPSAASPYKAGVWGRSSPRYRPSALRAFH